MPLISVHCLSSRMIEVQSQMSERAIELLALPEDTPCLILDIGLVLAPPTLHVTCLCYMFMLHVYVTCLCYMFMLHVYVTCLCYMFMLCSRFPLISILFFGNHVLYVHICECVLLLHYSCLVCMLTVEQFKH